MSIAAIARDHCLAPERVDAPIEGGRYRRLFEDRPPLEADERALHALGRPGDSKQADTYIGMVRYNIDTIVRALRD